MELVDRFIEFPDEIPFRVEHGRLAHRVVRMWSASRRWSTTVDIDIAATLPASMVFTVFIEELMSRLFMSAWTTVFQLFFTIIDPKYTVIAYAILAGDVVDQPISVSSIMTLKTLKVRVGGGLTW
jgi:hypothetical protein